MNWNSEEGQIILSVAYVLQENRGKPAKRAKERIAKLVTKRVYAKHSYELERAVYSLQPFENIKSTQNITEGKRGYSDCIGGRKPISDEVIAQMKFLRSEGLSVREIASLLKVGTGTVCKYTRGQEKE